MAWVRLSTSARNAAVNAVAAQIDASASAGMIKLYTGTAPASPDTAISSQVLLATLTFSDPAFGSAVTGTASANTIAADTSADATGTVTWARVIDSAGNAVMDIDVGTSLATLNLSTVSIVAGATVQVVSFSLTMPSGV